MGSAEGAGHQPADPADPADPAEPTDRPADPADPADRGGLDGRRPARRGRAWVRRSPGLLLLLALAVAGGVYLAAGIGGLLRAQDITRHAVRAAGTVVDNDGRGKFTVQVSYPTPDGELRATVNTPREAWRYPRGSRVWVEYAADAPHEVARADTHGGEAPARTQVLAGSIYLAAGLAVLAGIGWRRSRRRRATAQSASTSSLPYR